MFFYIDVNLSMDNPKFRDIVSYIVLISKLTNSTGKQGALVTQSHSY